MSKRKRSKITVALLLSLESRPIISWQPDDSEEASIAKQELIEIAKDGIYDIWQKSDHFWYIICIDDVLERP